MDRLTRRSSNGVAVYAAPSADAVKWKNTRYEVLQKLADYEDLEERLNKVYGDCDGLLLRVVSMLEKHPNIDMANNTLKSRLLTDEDVDNGRNTSSQRNRADLLNCHLLMIKQNAENVFTLKQLAIIKNASALNVR